MFSVFTCIASFLQVYQARRDEDKERYMREMEYIEKQNLQQQSEEVMMEAEPSNVNNDEPE